MWEPAAGVWLAHDPEQVEEIARATSTFSSAVPGERDSLYDFLLTVDPPRHTDDRRSFLRHFGTRMSHAVEAVPFTVSDVADRVAPGPVDLMASLCRPIGQRLSAEVLGWVDVEELSAAPMAIWEELRRSLGEQSSRDRREASPLMAIVHELDTGGLAPEVSRGRVAGLAVAMQLALEQTLPAAIGLALARLAAGQTVSETHPVASDTPLLGLYRIATRDVQMGPAHIRRGDRLFLAWAAANSETEMGRDFSYGIGAHRCPAAWLGDKVVRTATEYVGRQWNLELLEPPTFRPHQHFRSPDSLVCMVNKLDH
jgi:cytochrome P450